MTCEILRKRHDLRALVQQVLVLSLIVISGAVAASAQKDRAFFSPGNLVVSRSVYGNNPNNVQVGELLPPNCQATQAGSSLSPETLAIFLHPFAIGDAL
jgi:hypothetical protein